METSIATVCLSGGLNEKLSAIAAAGFRVVEIFESDLLSYSGTPADIAKELAALDLKVVTFRGNVQTRLRKLHDGVADGTILALAGLKRLGLDHVATDVMALDKFPPAPGQGAIAIESRIGDEATERMLAPIHDTPTGQALACERAFLAALDGSCRTPIAGYATVADDRIAFSGLILTPDGGQTHEIAASGLASDATRLGAEAGAEIRARAGEGFFDGWR